MHNDNINKTGNFKDGQWHVVHLRFLVDFMREASLTTGGVAEVMGLTRQAVYHWLAKDDMKMSQVLRLFELCGYSISFALEKESPPSALPVTVTMNVIRPLPPGRLSFLRDALELNSITKDRLAAELNLGRATVYNWFKVDDCLISYIYRVASVTGLRLKIHIQPIS